jgi:Zn-dependent protease with chaperone function
MIGFALVLVLALGALSALAAAAVVLAGGALRRRGPLAERRAIELAAVAPPLMAGALLLALVAQSYLGVDHCTRHDHHAHLCVAHGDGWSQRAWVVAVVSAAAALVLARLVFVVARLAGAAGAIRRLRALSRHDGDVRLVDSPHAFCFVAGVRAPEIFASTAAWRGLADDERAAMVAHERGHRLHGDVLRRLGLDLALIVAAPWVGAGLAGRWAHATERLRDADAARAVGDPEPVARALVRLCRLARDASLPGLAFAGRGRLLAERVEALLTPGPSGRRAARRLSIASTVSLAVLIALAAALAGPLHHALETLLG